MNKKTYGKGKRKKVWNLQKAFSLRTIVVCRFEKIDGVICLLHKTRLEISSEGTDRTLVSMCFFCIYIYIYDVSKYIP